MENITLKSKLIMGSLAMVVFVMVASTLVLSYLINRQNEKASFDLVGKALNIVSSDLSEKHRKRPSNPDNPDCHVVSVKHKNIAV